MINEQRSFVYHVCSHTYIGFKFQMMEPFPQQTWKPLPNTPYPTINLRKTNTPTPYHVDQNNNNNNNVENKTLPTQMIAAHARSFHLKSAARNNKFVECLGQLAREKNASTVLLATDMDSFPKVG